MKTLLLTALMCFPLSHAFATEECSSDAVEVAKMNFSQFGSKAPNPQSDINIEDKAKFKGKTLVKKEATYNYQVNATIGKMGFYTVDVSLNSDCAVVGVKITED